jgi:NAD(P)-dependent dehydrogenase (short-subunit alcohol dehydrogenase family)
MMQLSGTSAIVTGAASGLGAATAAMLVEQGATVFGFDLPVAIESRQGSVQAQAGGSSGALHFLPVDVTDPESVRQGVAAAAATGLPLRSVVNCAGIAPSERILGRRGVHDLGAYAKVVQVNLIGSFNVLALASEAIAAARPDEHGQRGVVVNTASIAAYDGQVGQAAYASSKGGIVSLTLAAARDLAQHGIRVMTIAPGIMLTPMMETVSDEYRAGLAAGVPFPNRLGAAGEYADLVRTIIGNDYLNGEVIRLDGSLRMAPR